MKGVGKPTPFVFLSKESVDLYECHRGRSCRWQESADGGGQALSYGR